MLDKQNTFSLILIAKGEKLKTDKAKQIGLRNVAKRKDDDQKNKNPKKRVEYVATYSRPRSFYSPKKLKLLVDDYFEKADQREPYKKVTVGKNGNESIEMFPRPYEVIGLCNHLKISRETFHVYSRGDYDQKIGIEYADEVNKYGTFSDILTDAKQIITNSLLDLGLNPFNRNVGTLNLNLMANYGFSKSEKVVSDNTNTNLNANIDVESKEPDAMTRDELYNTILKKVGAK